MITLVFRFMIILSLWHMQTLPIPLTFNQRIVEYSDLPLLDDRLPKPITQVFWQRLGCQRFFFSCPWEVEW